MFKYLVLTLALISFPILTFGQQQSKTKPMQAARDLAKEMERNRQEAEKAIQELKKRQLEELERIKKDNPERYKERKAQLERQVKIEKILMDFHSGKLTGAGAEQQLTPLVKEDMQVDVRNLGARVARLEKQLEFLKKAQKDPGLLVKRRLQRLLGKSSPSAEDSMY